MRTIPTSIPGFGCIYRPTYKDRHGVRQVSSGWWAKYKTDSGPVRRNLKTTDQQAAYEQLIAIAGKHVTGEIRDAKPETVTIGELLDLLIDNYRDKNTYRDVESRVRIRLRPQFGALKARDLRRIHLDQFVKRMKAEKKRPENSTINRHLAHLHRALVIGQENDLVKVVPRFPYQDEKGNVRTGIIEPDVYKDMRDALYRTAPHAGLAFVIGYYTGMRRGEILGLQWEQLDLEKGVIRLKPLQTKNKRPRVAPIYGEMRGVLEMAATIRLQKWPSCPWVVAYRGGRVYDLKTAWAHAAEEVGHSEAMFHDLRRTALSNMEEAHIERSVAMTISGHLTESAYRRYLIGSERRVLAAGAKMEQFYESLGKLRNGQKENTDFANPGTRQAERWYKTR